MRPVPFPYDIRQEFSKGRVKVHATFYGVPHDGSAVNMGLKKPYGSVCDVLGLRKAIREQLEKSSEDTIKVTVAER